MTKAQDAAEDRADQAREDAAEDRAAAKAVGAPAPKKAGTAAVIATLIARAEEQAKGVKDLNSVQVDKIVSQVLGDAGALSDLKAALAADIVARLGAKPVVAEAPPDLPENHADQVRKHAASQP